MITKEQLQVLLIDENNFFDYEEEQRKKKMQLVRGEFERCGKYGIPLIRKQDVNMDNIDLIGYTKTKMRDEDNRDKTIHFFMHDWKFANVYDKAEKALEKLEQYYALLTPEFSMYYDMPIARQIDSVFKSRWCGAFWQKQGLLVIPTMLWGLEESYDFCFDGVEEGSIVAVSTYARESYKNDYMLGYNKMLEVVKPSAIICYGEPFEEMKGNIKSIDPFNKKELIQKIGIEEYMKKYLEGKLYPEC